MPNYPAQTLGVAGDLCRAPATFENPGLVEFEWCQESKQVNVQYKTNIFYLSVHVYCDNTQRTSTCCKDVSQVTHLWLNSILFCSNHVLMLLLLTCGLYMYIIYYFVLTMFCCCWYVIRVCIHWQMESICYITIKSCLGKGG